jgi:Spy/CpxP family protein refolding chaperone
MKRIRTITAIAIMATIVTASSALAQRGQGRGFMNNPNGRGMVNNMQNPDGYGQCILNLTPEQDSKITELRTKHIKEVTPLRNELGEKSARLRTLQSADSPNLNEINKTIDEMASIRANIQKKGAAHRAEVSSILTDEQRVVYNSRGQGRMGRGGQGMGRSGRGNGQGMGRGLRDGSCRY